MARVEKIEEIAPPEEVLLLPQGGEGGAKEVKHILAFTGCIMVYHVYHGLPCSAQPKRKFTLGMLILPHSINQES